MDTYGILPSLDLLTDLANSVNNHDVTFEAVGYGLQDVHPGESCEVLQYPLFFCLWNKLIKV